MAASSSAFHRLAETVAARGVVYPDLFPRAFAGPKSGFFDDAREALRSNEAAIAFQADLDTVRSWVAAECGRKGDRSLAARWEGICEAMLFALTRDGTSLDKSIDWFDKALESLTLPGVGERYPSPAATGRQAEVVKKFFADRSPWTAGTFIVYDWLLGLTGGADPAVLREATPILSVVEDAGDRYLGAVQKLVVEKRDRPSGLITPDFFSFGLVAFPPEAGGNFLAVMHEAFLAAQPQRGVGRLRWGVEPLFGEYAAAFSGRSAQVAAASCVLALADGHRPGDGPLLDEGTAVTACLGPATDAPATWPLLPFDHATGPADRHRLAEVEGRKLEAKFDAAARARLVAVLVCESQLPQRQVRTVKLGDGSNHTLLIQPVSTLEEAYDSLLITSEGMRKYAAGICDNWPWVERETPQEYIDATQRNRR